MEMQKDETYYTVLDIIQNYFIEYLTNKNRQDFVADERAYVIIKDMCNRIIKRDIELLMKDVKYDNLEDKIPKIVNDTIGDKITWGRIASVIAFGAYSTNIFKKEGKDDLVDNMPDTITGLILDICRDWMVEQDCWNGFYNSILLKEKFGYIISCTRIAAFVITSLAIANLFIKI
ncbi:SWPV1-049 [Shearwaterpox virus]|uniref:Apoptosis regulator Bcl-2 homolog n=1 Tax=Shearwaterpox virus TaxID=1974596 RepID=A0A1V0S7R2_CNPV|nr:SWPV1-049 [Shearwaterpox virus]